MGEDHVLNVDLHVNYVIPLSFTDIQSDNLVVRQK